MKAITLHQPWASAIALGLKGYETRSWAPTYRGLLAIHAGKLTSGEQMNFLHSLHVNFPSTAQMDYARLPFGAIVCICNLTAVYHAEALRPDIAALERALGNFEDGRAALKLELVTTIAPPIPARGQQGLWNWDCPSHIAHRCNIGGQSHG